MHCKFSVLCYVIFPGAGVSPAIKKLMWWLNVKAQTALPEPCSNKDAALQDIYTTNIHTISPPWWWRQQQSVKHWRLTQSLYVWLPEASFHIVAKKASNLLFSVTCIGKHIEIVVKNSMDFIQRGNIEVWEQLNSNSDTWELF